MAINITYSLDVFNDNEAKEFIKRKLPNETELKVLKLANTLGNLPLALSQAIAYILKAGTTIDSYLKVYEQSPEIALSSPLLIEEDNRYPHTVLKTFYLSQSKLNQLSIKMLRLCAYLSPYKIPRWLLQNCLGYDEHTFNVVISDLRDYSLISSKLNHISLHRLVQIAVRIFLLKDTLEIEFVKEALQLLDKQFNYDKDKQQYLEESRNVFPHAEALLKHAQRLEIKTEALRSIYIKLGAYLLYEHHEARVALEYFHRALNLNETKKLLENQILLGTLYYHLATACCWVGNHRLAETYAVKSCDTFKEQQNREKNSLCSSENLVSPLSVLGYVHFRNGNYQLSKEKFFEALEISDLYYPDKRHPNLGAALHWLGYVFLYEENYDKAEIYFRQALESKQKTYEMDRHTEIALTYDALSDLYCIRKDYTKATDCYKKSLDIKHEINGKKDHLLTAINYYNFGRILSSQERYAEAIENYCKALCIRLHIYGVRHFATSDVLRAFGALFGNIGEYELSIRCYLLSLAAQKLIYNGSHLDTAITLSRSAETLFKAERSFEAKFYAEKALEAYEKCCMTKHSLKLQAEQLGECIVIDSAEWKSLKQNTKEFVLIEVLLDICQITSDMPELEASLKERCLDFLKVLEKFKLTETSQKEQRDISAIENQFKTASYEHFKYSKTPENIQQKLIKVFEYITQVGNRSHSQSETSLVTISSSQFMSTEAQRTYDQRFLGNFQDKAVPLLPDIQHLLQQSKISPQRHQDKDIVEIIFTDKKIAQQFQQTLLSKYGIHNLGDPSKKEPRKINLMEIEKAHNKEFLFKVLLTGEEYNTVMDDKQAYAALINAHSSVERKPSP